MSSNGSMRWDKFPSGIAGVSVGEIERQIPAGEAPPLPTNDRLAVIGKPVPRINGRAKVTGAARFTVDIKLPGMLHARLLRSPHAHAQVISIDTRVAEHHPDVRAVHVITDIVGRAIERDPDTDTSGAPKLPRVLYVGAPIAAVAATTEAAADAALSLIKIEYEVLPFVVDMEDACKPDAPMVFHSPVTGSGFAGGVSAGAEFSSKETSADLPKPVGAAMLQKALPKPTPWSKGNFARKCRHIAARKPMPSSPIGGLTD